MAKHQILGRALLVLMTAAPLLMTAEIRADDLADTQRRLADLEQQNRALQEQLKQQSTLIESLNRKVGEMQNPSLHFVNTTEEVDENVKSSRSGSSLLAPSGFGRLNISGEGGVALFNTGNQGAYPNTEFRLDEAKLFFEAPIFKDVYAFLEVNLATREYDEVSLNLGEAYVDFENISKLWHRDHMLNLRVGRLDIPYGEEYLYRDVIDNALISRSLSDFWGVDEGLEFYGCLGPLSYCLALQNGGIPDTHDYNADKSLAGRLSADPLKWLHLSVSGMRTGELDSNKDYFSAMWFGSGFFRSLGMPTATSFHANMAEADVEIRLPRGHVRAFGGYVRYDDNATGVDNGRDVWYYSVEAIHDLTKKFYAGGRFSQILCDKGIPVAGYGDFGHYFFGPLTEEIWRLSLGLGYRFNQNLILKAEYSFEQGKLVSGAGRNNEDFFGVEAAFKF